MGFVMARVYRYEIGRKIENKIEKIRRSDTQFFVSRITILVHPERFLGRNIEIHHFSFF